MSPAQARGFAAKLIARGVLKGDNVVVWGENRPEWIACYWGIQLAGAIAVPIDYRSSREFADRIRGIVGARIVLAGDDVDPGSMEAWKLADLDWSEDGPVPAITISRDDIAQIVFTSGATADPKGVVIRHRNILANTVPVAKEIDKYKKYARPFSPIRFLNLLPLSHMFGQSMATNIPPLIDGTVVFMRSFNPHDIVRRVREWRISVIVCVPEDPRRAQGARASRRSHGGRSARGPVDPGALVALPEDPQDVRHEVLGLHRRRRAARIGARGLLESGSAFVVIQGYGLTETAPIVTMNHPFKTNTGSVGKPIAGVEVKIAEDGEILVRGENVTTGYFEPASAREASFGEAAGRTVDEAGWLHTGDIGEKDAEGRLFIRGRKKEMIVTPEGLNVFPDDVERPLNAQAGVIESAVVGTRAAEGSEERVHAVLRLDPGVEPESVVRTANSDLADHQRIRGFSIWSDGPLPRTEGTKKLKRAAIKAWVEAGAAPAAASHDDPLQGLLAKFAGSRQLDGGTSIEGLGLSSLERVELMVALEDQFQTRIDETKFAGAKTLDDLRAVIASAPEEAQVAEPVDFPSWNRAWPVRLVRRISQATWILPLARIFAWVRVSGPRTPRTDRRDRSCSPPTTRAISTCR
jgi:long-chain acyl-CoA synthetase